MTFAQTLSLISLSALGLFVVIVYVCALGRCRHTLTWQQDHNAVVRRCACGQVTIRHPAVKP